MMTKKVKFQDTIVALIILGALLFPACQPGMLYNDISEGCETCSITDVEKFAGRCFGDQIGDSDYIAFYEVADSIEVGQCCSDIKLTGDGAGIGEDYGFPWGAFSFNGQMIDPNSATIEITGSGTRTDEDGNPVETEVLGELTLNRADSSGPLEIRREGWRPVTLDTECQRNCPDAPRRDLITGCFRSDSEESWLFIADDRTACDRVTGRLAGIFTDDTPTRASWNIEQSEITADNRATLTVHNDDVANPNMPTRTIHINRIEGALDIDIESTRPEEDLIAVRTLRYRSTIDTVELCGE